MSVESPDWFSFAIVFQLLQLYCLSRKMASSSLNPTSKSDICHVSQSGKTSADCACARGGVGGQGRFVFTVTEKSEGCSVINEKMAK